MPNREANSCQTARHTRHTPVRTDRLPRLAPRARRPIGPVQLSAPHAHLLASKPCPPPARPTLATPFRVGTRHAKLPVPAGVHFGPRLPPEGMGVALTGRQARATRFIIGPPAGLPHPIFGCLMPRPVLPREGRPPWNSSAGPPCPTTAVLRTCIPTLPRNWAFPCPGRLPTPQPSKAPVPVPSCRVAAGAAKAGRKRASRNTPSKTETSCNRALRNCAGSPIRQWPVRGRRSLRRG